MKAASKRETSETRIEMMLETEGTGNCQIETGIELLDEILLALAQGAHFDLTVKARGDLETGDHHTSEDIGITLGKTLAGVAKMGMGSSIVPSGQSLAMVAVRFGESGYRGDFEFHGIESGGMCLENFGHMLRAAAHNGNFTLLVRADGGNDRSKIEAMSTALGRALQKALQDGKRRS